MLPTVATRGEENFWPARGVKRVQVKANVDEYTKWDYLKHSTKVVTVKY